MKALTKVNRAYNLPKVDELWCYKGTQHFKGKLHVINFRKEIVTIVFMGLNDLVHAHFSLKNDENQKEKYIFLSSYPGPDDIEKTEETLSTTIANLNIIIRIGVMHNSLSLRLYAQ